MMGLVLVVLWVRVPVEVQAGWFQRCRFGFLWRRSSRSRRNGGVETGNEDLVVVVAVAWVRKLSMKMMSRFLSRAFVGDVVGLE